MAFKISPSVPGNLHVFYWLKNGKKPKPELAYSVFPEVNTSLIDIVCYLISI